MIAGSIFHSKFVLAAACSCPCRRGTVCCLRQGVLAQCIFVQLGTAGIGWTVAKVWQACLSGDQAA